eukprot:comp45723_c0_seq1/m.47562 comp45723_c0_seq1/g.47562  ORF comp45723_c0_seq1/g.47562 comp45723_c0_seq1/m.47562 type:complete len:167 (-) comp45723_c0_seq1:116-616(-)
MELGLRLPQKTRDVKRFFWKGDTFGRYKRAFVCAHQSPYTSAWSQVRVVLRFGGEVVKVQPPYHGDRFGHFISESKLTSYIHLSRPPFFSATMEGGQQGHRPGTEGKPDDKMRKDMTHEEALRIQAEVAQAGGDTGKGSYPARAQRQADRDDKYTVPGGPGSEKTD